METVARLDGWKEIANYLNRAVKTAQRWEAERGLPVHRVGGDGPGGSVFAFRHEVDTWLLGASSSPDDGEAPGDLGALGEDRAPGRPNRKLRVAALFLLVSTAAVLLGSRTLELRHSPAAVGTRDERLLIAYDAAGREIWRHLEDEPFSTVLGDSLRPVAEVVDLDGDGVAEIVALLRNPDGAGRLVAFDADGSVRWERVAGGSISLDGEDFLDSYSQYSFELLRSRDRVWVASVARHRPHFPTWVEWVAGATGERVGAYLHTGYLFQFLPTDLDGDGHQELMAGGYNNYFGSPVLMVLEPGGREALSPGPSSWSGDREQGRERVYLRFESSMVARELGIKSWVRELRRAEGHFLVEIRAEDVVDRQERVYLLDQRFEIVALELPRSFEAWFDELSSAGRISHGLHHEVINGRRVEWLVDGRARRSPAG